MQSLKCSKCKKPFESEDLDKKWIMDLAPNKYGAGGSGDAVCLCQEDSEDPSFFKLLEIMQEYNQKLSKL